LQKALLLIAFSGSLSLAQTVGKPIPIGAALAETSNVALLGQEEVQGVKLGEEYVNTHGGINGVPIQVILEDTGGGEQGAINAFQLLIKKDQVVGIIGPVLSQQAFAADPIADQEQTPVIGPSNTANGIPEIGPFVSRVSAPVAVYAPGALSYLLSIDPKIHRVAQFYAHDDAFSKDEAKVFRAAFRAHHLDIVDVEKTTTNQTDFISQITTALAKHPQLIEISTLAADGGNLVKQLRQFGYKGPIIGGNGLNTTAIFPVCQQYCTGVYIAEAYSPALKNPINDWLEAHYQAKYHQEVPQLTAQAFTAVQVMAVALRRVEAELHRSVVGLPLAKVRVLLNKAIQETRNLITPLGSISIIPVPKGGGEIHQARFYVAEIVMNPNGKTGVFKYVY
jgi:branched-chain amino acid transport system substrate-binding protein